MLTLIIVSSIMCMCTVTAAAPEMPFKDMLTSNDDVDGQCLNKGCKGAKPVGYELGVCAQTQDVTHTPSPHNNDSLKQCLTCMEQGKEECVWWDDLCGDCNGQYIKINADDADTFLKTKDEVRQLIQACVHLRSCYDELGHLKNEDSTRAEYKIQHRRMKQQMTMFASPIYKNSMLFEKREEYVTNYMKRWKKLKIAFKWIGCAVAVAGGITSMGGTIGSMLAEPQSFHKVFVSFTKDLNLVFGQTKRAWKKGKSNGFIGGKASKTNETETEVDMLNCKTSKIDAGEPAKALSEFIGNLRKFYAKITEEDMKSEKFDEQRQEITRFRLELNTIVGQGIDIPRTASFKGSEEDTIHPEYKLRFFKFVIRFGKDDDKEECYKAIVDGEKGLTKDVDYINCTRNSNLRHGWKVKQDGDDKLYYFSEENVEVDIATIKNGKQVTHKYHPIVICKNGKQVDESNKYQETLIAAEKESLKYNKIIWTKDQPLEPQMVGTMCLKEYQNVKYVYETVFGLKNTNATLILKTMSDKDYTVAYSALDKDNQEKCEVYRKTKEDGSFTYFSKIAKNQLLAGIQTVFAFNKTKETEFLKKLWLPGCGELDRCRQNNLLNKHQTSIQVNRNRIGTNTANIEEMRALIKRILRGENPIKAPHDEETVLRAQTGKGRKMEKRRSVKAFRQKNTPVTLPVTLAESYHDEQYSDNTDIESN